MEKITSNEKPTYIDLFAGCGGLSLGLHASGWKGIFAVEKSKDAFKTLQHNLIDNRKHFEWPEWLPKSNHDINQVISQYQDRLSEMKGHVDMVVGGPPCQGFSTAGRRQEGDERNKLIKSYVKFIGLLSPKVIFFENVRGFTLEFKKNRDKGKAYSQYVINALRRLGYIVKGELIDFSEYGVPQKRTRFILVGVHRDVAQGNKKVAKEFFEQLKINRESFLKEKGLPLNPSLKDSISDLLRSNGVVDSPDMSNFKAGVYSDPLTKYQIALRRVGDYEYPDSHRFANHRPHIVSRFEYILKESIRNKNLDKKIRAKYSIRKHTIIPLDPDDSSPTITTLPDDYIHYCEPRILTVREYARIQSFPDWYHFKGKYTTGGKMRTKEVPRYSQIGNAIPPLFGEQVGLTLRKTVSR